MNSGIGSLPVVRWVVFACGLLCFLLSTVLYSIVGRHLFGAMQRSDHCKLLLAPPWARSALAQRVWGAVAGIASLVIWWLLGTPAGVSTMHHVLGGAP